MYDYMATRMFAWIIVFVIAMVCGLALDHTTLFWVGICSLWVMSKMGGSDD
jgi:hypothetical protein